jgi:hypothetical protein
MIDINKLNIMYSYNSETGELKRVEDSSNRDFVTHIKLGEVDGELIAQHKDEPKIKGSAICWALYYGKYPEGKIIYKNGNRLDLRIRNLIEISNIKYLNAVNSISLAIHFNNLSKEIDYNDPKSFKKQLFKNGLTNLGIENVLADLEIKSKGWKHGRVYKNRIISMIMDVIYN